MLESEIQKAITDYLAARKIFCWKNHNTGVPNGRGGLRKGGKKGVSDILGIYKGRFLAIEVKTPKGKTTEAQDQFLAQVVKNGGIGFVARSVDNVKELLELFDRAENL